MDIRELKRQLGVLEGLEGLIGRMGTPHEDSSLIGEYVIVRCKDAGVHAGYLESYQGRECVLRDARRLWYWKVANGGMTLNGVATEGLDSESRVAGPVQTIVLTENCEIIQTSKIAADSIQGAAIAKAK